MFSVKGATKATAYNKNTFYTALWFQPCANSLEKTLFCSSMTVPGPLRHDLMLIEFPVEKLCGPHRALP